MHRRGAREISERGTRKTQLFSAEACYLQLDLQLYLDLLFLSSLRKIFSKLQTAYCGGEIPDLMISFVALWSLTGTPYLTVQPYRTEEVW